MKTYCGIREGAHILVTVDGEPLPLCLDLRNHSPTGFNWGYSGSGPAQLALAIMNDFAPDIAPAVYQEFKRKFVATIHEDQWQITSHDIQQWLQANPTLLDSFDRRRESAGGRQP